MGMEYYKSVKFKKKILEKLFISQNMHFLQSKFLSRLQY